MVELSAGNRVAGYALLARLASSGLADIWLARDTSLKGHTKTVVLKTLSQHRNAPTELLATIFSEAKYAADLDHPNIVQVFDVAPHLDSFFIAMEYVAGRTLRQLLTQLRRRRLVPPEALILHVAHCVCEALQYAHNRQRDNLLAPVIHRAIRPENIILSYTGDTKILAFGSARSSILAAAHSGPSPYSPPNLAVADLYDSQAPTVDIYALGVTIAECLTGDAFCWNDDGWSNNDIPTLRAAAPWIGSELDSVICKAMAQSPASRYQSAEEFGAALSNYFKRNGTPPMRSQLSKYLCVAFADDTPPNLDPGGFLPIGPDDRLGLETATRKSDIPHPLHLDWNDSEIEPLSVREPPREIILPGIPQMPEPVPVSPAQTSQSSRPPANNNVDSDDKGHVWDLLTGRVRAERVARESNPDIDLSLLAAPIQQEKIQEILPPTRGWDAAVRKARGSEPDFPTPPAPKPALSPAERAIRVFDEGVACMREKSYARAFELWNEAANLDPENRLYQTNLRRLKKRMDEEPSG